MAAVLVTGLMAPHLSPWAGTALALYFAAFGLAFPWAMARRWVAEAWATPDFLGAMERLRRRSRFLIVGWLAIVVAILAADIVFLPTPVTADSVVLLTSVTLAILAIQTIPSRILLLLRRNSAPSFPSPTGRP